MRSTDPPLTVIRYRRSKALAFGTMMLAIGAGIAWLAWDALDPDWTSPTDDGALLQALPYWVRVPFIMVIATIVLTPGVTMLWSGLRDTVVVRADADGISARTIFGRRRYLSWDNIVSAKGFGAENQIVLSPAGADTYGAGNFGPEISSLGYRHAGSAPTRRRSVGNAPSSRSQNCVQAESRRLNGSIGSRWASGSCLRSERRLRAFQ